MTDKKPTLAERLAAEGYIVKACKGCGKLMVWALKENGVWLPLDPVAPTYTVVTIKDYAGRPQHQAVRNMMTFVLHHVTCPNREMFSGGKK